ncbi:glycosyltransferase [Candidatus Sumerlaeota bacterium]|nr:glycosyltransferase [Candidatus Sumerlaeota bacterium]
MRNLICQGHHFYQDGQKWLVKGVTYGPFRPNKNQQPYPEIKRLEEDFAAIVRMGANAIRLYTVPDEQVAEAAMRHGLMLLVDIPWPKHLDVYGDPGVQELCLRMLDEGLQQCKDWPNLLGLCLGNEIPADLARWVGARRVESFLRRLYDRVKDQDAKLLAGYANYPSTEYLRLNFFDFIGFNVYMHDAQSMRNYLLRLRHLYPETPLILSEFGLDSESNDLKAQADIIYDGLKAAFEVGLAGGFVFSWTDEWHTGGYDMTEWAFGLVDTERRIKPALHAASRIYLSAPHFEKIEPLKFSVVVATYNGGRTLRQCLESLEQLDYPDYEVIVVDDGSTDDTQEILKDFPKLRVVTQTNQGLSLARNSGIEAATGDIVAFTDSDCFVDRDWLYHLALIFQRKDIAGAGGPNLTPPEDRLAARAVALAPGHATHVLIDYDEVEHVPGCNMAFRREVLLEAGGFDPVFRKAGDDVDIIWRLRDMGHRMAFAPGAFVWHYRRPTLKSYCKQQLGYGEAEALLINKHPHRFNDLGQSIWSGFIYGSVENQALMRKPNVRYGVFCSSGYQCIYHRPSRAFSHLLTSFEWWFICLGLLLAGFFAKPVLFTGLAGIAASIGMNLGYTWRRMIGQRDFSTRLFFNVLLLWILQPVLRGGMRYWRRLRTIQPSTPPQALKDDEPRVADPFLNAKILRYWGEETLPRLDVVRKFAGKMARRHWIFTPNTEWEPWDLSVVVSWWFKVRLTTSEENHGAGKRLLRIRLRLVPTTLLRILSGGSCALVAALFFHNTIWARGIAIGLLLLYWLLYRQGRRLRLIVERQIDVAAREMGYDRMPSQAEEIEVRRDVLAKQS